VAPRLHDHPASSNCLKVRLLLAELELPYERLHVNMHGERPEWHTRVYDTVPVLADGDVHVGESNTILRYLARREGRDDLYPSAPVERSRVDWALDLWSVEIRPSLLRLEEICLWEVDREHGSGDPGAADPARVRTVVDEPIAQLDRFERFIGADGHVVLGSFTIADVAAAPVVWRMRRLPLPHGRWPRVARFREAITGRPAWPAAEPVV
jgi:glutathione S-transferase